MLYYKYYISLPLNLRRDTFLNSGFKIFDFDIHIALLYKKRYDEIHTTNKKTKIISWKQRKEKINSVVVIKSGKSHYGSFFPIHYCI